MGVNKMRNIKKVFGEPVFYWSIWFRFVLSSLFSVITGWIYFDKSKNGTVALVMSYAMVHALDFIFFAIGVVSAISFVVDFRKITMSKDFRNEGVSLLNANSMNPFYSMTNDFLNEAGIKIRSRLILHVVFFMISFLFVAVISLIGSYFFGITGRYPMIGA